MGRRRKVNVLYIKQSWFSEEFWVYWNGLEILSDLKSNLKSFEYSQIFDFKIFVNNSALLQVPWHNLWVRFYKLKKRIWLS